MKFTSTFPAMAALVLTMGLQANEGHAATVTHGFLTSDDTTNVITDSQNDRLYTRLDAFNLSVADTMAAIDVGGAWEGWSIADSAIIGQFAAALLGVADTACTLGGYGTTCGTLTGWTDGDFGVSYDFGYDYIAFLSTGAANPIGLMEIQPNGLVSNYPGWSSASDLDLYGITTYPQYPINLMLYQNVAAVPIPAGGLMLLAALGGLGMTRKRRKAA